MDTRQVSALVHGVAERVATIERGTTIEHEALAHMFMLNWPDEQKTYYQLVQHLKKVLMKEHGVFFKLVPRKGYTAVTHGDEIDLCVGKWVGGIKRMYQATRETEYIQVDDIADSEKKSATIMKANKMASITGMLRLGQRAKGSLTAGN